MTPEVSLVIATLNRESALRKTLQTVLSQKGVLFEVIVVDQSPKPEPLPEDSRIVPIHEPLPSLPRARNIGMLAARAPIVVFIDDDVLLPQGFLRGYRDLFRNPKLGGACGMILLPGEKPGDLPPLPVPPAKARDRLDLRIVRHTTPVINPLHFVGANMAFRKSSLLRIGGFSHAFTGCALGEDIHIAGRMRSAGIVTVYTPKIFLTHCVEETGGTRTEDSGEFQRQRERMRHYYYALFHGDRLRNAIPAVLRRVKSVPQGKQGTGAAVGRSRIASAAGRILGIWEGIASSIRDRSRCGSLEEIEPPAQPPHPCVSIIIATFNRPSWMVETLLKLRMQSVSSEIIVVDQSASMDAATRDSIRPMVQSGSVRYIRLKRPNASLARNIGARKAKGEILLFLDDDITPDSDLVKRHLEAYSHGVVAVGGRIAWHAGHAAERRQFPHPYWMGRGAIDAPVCYYSTPFSDAGHLITCNLSVRKEAFEKVGGFREWFRGYGEDLELVSRLRKIGRTRYEPKALVLHHVSETGGTRSGRGSWMWLLRRGMAHHYSTLLSVGLVGWMGVELRRQGRRIVRRFFPAEGGGTRTDSASIIKLFVTRLIAIPAAFFLYVFTMSRRGDFR